MTVDELIAEIRSSFPDKRDRITGFAIEGRPWNEAAGRAISTRTMRGPNEPTLQGLPEGAPAEWVRCGYGAAEQHRYRVLTGSIGLEGPWSEWTDGKPEKTLMQREYRYRRRRDSKGQ